MNWIMFIVVPFLVGCASEKELQMAYLQSHQAVMAQADMMSKQPPTLTIDCTGGCGSAKIDYLDPRDRHKLIIPKVTNTNDTIVGVAPSIVKGVGYVAGAVTAIRVADDLFKNSGNGERTENHTTNITNGDGNTNDQSLTASASEANDNIQSADNNQDNDVSLADSSNDNSTRNEEDNSVANNDDNSDNSQQNQTSDPTVIDPTVTVVEPIVVEPVVIETEPLILNNSTCSGLGC